ncbi:MAG TPA: radical SAM protein [Myxococcota bacterium]|jgi:radical SAM superfamily enzyme YgiQ (UPF0313 family)|nr:radical SAM protein [Myxococcota bacterium]
MAARPRVGLLLVYGDDDRCTLKDVAGGFGTRFSIGRSPGARLLEYAKKRIVHLPPITVAYLVALFEQRGWEVVLGDGGPATPRCDLFLVHSSIVDCAAERAAMRDLRARFPRARVGVFGTFASMVPDFYDGAADFLVKGEVEAAVDRIAADYATLAGTLDAGFLKDADALPYPAWDHFPYDTYRYSIITTKGITLPMLSARGCAYACGYCPYTVNARFRERTVEGVVDEIYYDVHRYGAHGISFRDPLFNLRAERIAGIAEEILLRELDVRFSIEARTDRLTPELVRLLHRAGLRSIEVGIDSVDVELVRRNRRKPPALEQQERIIDACHRAGVRVIANFCLGLPGDSAETIRRTIDYAKRLNTFAIQFTVSTPYPGTKLFHDVKADIFDWDYEHWNGWTNVYRHPNLSPEALHALREEAYVDYHFRPAYAARFLQQTLLSR